MIAVLHSSLLLGIIDPGQGTKPPGGDQILEIVKWGAWILFAGAVLAVMVAGGKMMWAQKHGGMTSDHTSSLVYTFAGLIILGAAATIVQTLA